MGGEGRRRLSDRSNRIVKQLERMKKIWKVRLERLEDQEKKDDFLNWEALGIDASERRRSAPPQELCRHTKMARIAGLPLANSQRAFDLYLKTRYTWPATEASSAGSSWRRPRRWPTAWRRSTPSSVTCSRTRCDALGLEQFDAWAATFGETVSALEIAPDGSGYRLNTRFARFINVPDLMGVFCDVSDIRTKEMLELAGPAH